MRFLLCIGFLCLMVAASAQKGKTTPKKAQMSSKKQNSKDQPPPTEESIVDVRIDTTVENIPPPPPVEIAMNFDTSASPEDSLTVLIRQLMTITDARAADIKAAEASLKESMKESLANPATAEMTQKFYDRFMFEMKEGRAARWMENLYIRKYRKLFTYDEIQAMIAFYETPAGKKTLEKTRLLLMEIMGEAQKMGGYIGQDIMTKVIAEVYK